MRFIRYFLVSVPFLIAGIVYAREMPKIKAWILNKIQIVSNEKAGLEIKAREINFRFLPPGVELKNLKLIPQSDLARTVSPTTIDSVLVTLSPTSLIAGRFEIGSIVVDHPVSSIFIRKKDEKVAAAASGGSGAGQSQGDIFDQFISVPIKGITVTHAEIRGRVDSVDLAWQLRDFGFHFEKNYQAAKVDIFAPDTTIKKMTGTDSALNLGLATRIILEKNALEVAALKATQGHNFFMLGGVARGEVLKGEFPFLNGRTIAHFDLAEAQALAKLFVPNLKIPQLSGELDFEILAKQLRGKDPHFAGEISTKDIKVGKFVVGDISSKLNYASGVLSTKSINLKNNSGSAKIEDFELHHGKELKLAGRLNVQQIALQTLLDDVDVQVPLYMDVNANIPCEGIFSPIMKFDCAGEVNGSNFRVYSKSTHRTIAALKSFKIAASLSGDGEKVIFPKAIITFGKNTQGTASGSVDYEKGFNFAYHTDRLDFSDVESLAELKYDGYVALTGTATGTSHVGSMDAQLTTPNFYFEDYGLGTFSAHVQYGAGYVKISDVKGQNGNTIYTGGTNVLVDDDLGDHVAGIKSLGANINPLDLSDLKSIFGRKVQLPVDFSGTGSAQVTASGGFSLSQLTYTMRGQTQRGMMAGESYQEAHFDLHGVHGHAFADDISLKKGDGTVKLTGDVLATGVMNVDVKGQNLRLMDSEHARNLASGLDGRVNFDMTMHDFILTPQMLLKATLSQTTLNQQLLEDSDFEIGFSRKNMTLNAQLFAKKLSTRLVYPFVKNEPFAFNFETTNWDFTSFLGITGKTSGLKDYEASLSAKIDLTSKEGDFWKSHGSAFVSHLYLRHGTSQMKNAGPLSLRFDDGNINVDKFKIEGDNTQLSLTGGKNKNDNLNFNVSGRVDLALLTFLTPFFREMSGELSLSTQVGGTLSHPDLLGSAFLKKGYFKLEVLPQAFEDISADLLFSQQRVLVNRLAGHLGGGQLAAGGGITFHSIGDVPVDLAGDLTGSTLTVLEGLTTHGDFHFSVTGNWFPYLLKGDFNIENGLYVKNFEDDSNTDVKRSAFLPKLLLQKQFIPIELDVATHIRKGLTVKNATMTADVKGDITAKGDPAHSIFKGDIEAVPGGKIFFNETPFTITECKVGFKANGENNPDLYTLATTHVRDWDVTLLLQGTKNKYKLELTSTPPLPEKSIISLLALGVTEEDEIKTQQKQVFPTYGGATTPGGAVQAPTTDTGGANAGQAASLLLQKVELRNELKRKFGVNVRVTDTFDETRNIVMPTVSAEKEWTPQISTSVSRTMGAYVTQDVRTEYRLNRHFSLEGSYIGRDSDYLTAPSPTGATSSNLPLDIFGVDLQYQMEFK